MPECSEWPTFTTTTVFVSGIAVTEPLLLIQNQVQSLQVSPGKCKGQLYEVNQSFFF